GALDAVPGSRPDLLELGAASGHVPEWFAPACPRLNEKPIHAVSDDLAIGGYCARHTHDSETHVLNQLETALAALTQRVVKGHQADVDVQQVRDLRIEAPSTILDREGRRHSKVAPRDDKKLQRHIVRQRLKLRHELLQVGEVAIRADPAEGQTSVAARVPLTGQFVVVHARRYDDSVGGRQIAALALRQVLQVPAPCHEAWIEAQGLLELGRVLAEQPTNPRELSRLPLGGRDVVVEVEHDVRVQREQEPLQEQVAVVVVQQQFAPDHDAVEERRREALEPPTQQVGRVEQTDPASVEKPPHRSLRHRVPDPAPEPPRLEHVGPARHAVD